MQPTQAVAKAPDKAPEHIAGMFNGIASTYDTLNDVMTLGMHRGWKQRACEQLQLKPGAQVLDLCTGTGDLAAMLASIVGPTGKVHALDFSEGMLALGKERFGHLPHIEFTWGDAMDLPLTDNLVDGAIISFGLRNVLSAPQVLSEMARVTKPGGWVAILDTASDYKNPLFWLYFRTIMPRLGALLSRNEDAYRYLCQSTETFMPPRAMCQTLQELGLRSVTHTPLGFGSVALVRGQKPA